MGIYKITDIEIGSYEVRESSEESLTGLNDSPVPQQAYREGLELRRKVFGRPRDLRIPSPETMRDYWRERGLFVESPSNLKFVSGKESDMER